MERELARKQPANVITTVPRAVSHTTAGVIIIRDRNRTVVTQQVAKMYGLDQIEREYRLGRDEGQWVAAVVPRAPRSWVRRNGLKLALAASGTVAFLAGLAWAVRALVLALAAALPIVAGFLVCLVVLFGLASLAGGGQVIEVIQKVKIKR
jgi:hypothetical protein